MYKCPFPECEYNANYIILNSHAKSHGFRTVEMMTKVHGKILHINPDAKVMKRIQETVPNISAGHFNSVDMGLARMMKADTSEVKNRTF